MAHGSPRIVVCYHCKQYSWIERFSQDPKCPICNKQSEQITKEELREKYNLSHFYDFGFYFDWIKIDKNKPLQIG